MENNYNYYDDDYLVGNRTDLEDMHQDFKKGVLEFFEKFYQVHPRSLIFTKYDDVYYMEDIPEYECKVELDSLSTSKTGSLK